jgi:hypothetical protein
VIVMYKGRKEEVCLYSHDNIGLVKTRLSSSLGIPQTCQILMYNGEILDNGKLPSRHGVLHLALAFRASLSPAPVPIYTADCRFTDESAHRYDGKILDLTVNSDTHPTPLGIGAGGRIIQHIERDENDPRIWDVANSKILNVQILDSTAFRLVTGLNPPETPISTQTYKEMGLPFYRLWRDEGKEDGVAGVWGDLMGVAEVASKNGKDKQNAVTLGSVGSGKWGLQKTGAWGLIGREEASAKGEGGEGGEGGFKETSFDFPIVLLDVDDTLPRFRSAAEPEELDEVWEGMDEDDMYDLWTRPG